MQKYNFKSDDAKCGCKPRDYLFVSCVDELLNLHVMLNACAILTVPIRVVIKELQRNKLKISLHLMPNTKD